jgi:hypothetical protein
VCGPEFRILEHINTKLRTVGHNNITRWPSCAEAHAVSGQFAAIDSRPASASSRAKFRHVQRLCEHELTKGRNWTWGDGSSELHRRRLWQEIRACLGFAVLGCFKQAQPRSLPLRTSCNKVLRLFSERYTPANFSEELTEVSIKEGGRAEVTGFPVLGSPW